jgi:PiT family inorganic phosphate transporter
MAVPIVLALAALFLAYANGANDNFKGVATLYGSGATDYRRALVWASITTFAGTIVAIYLGADLVESFSGKGLVPDALAVEPRFLGAVGLGAALTVLAATRLGFPISTTHAITGALVGAGLAGAEVSFAELPNRFFLPLLVSPVLALLAAMVLYPIFRFVRVRTGVSEESFVAIAGETLPVPAGVTLPAGRFTFTAALADRWPSAPRLVAGDEATVVRRYAGHVVGWNAHQILNVAHYLSAGAASFARGLNDAPKIAAILIAAQALELHLGLALVAVAMAAGGLLGARRIADTMSMKITAMNAGQGFTANLVTSGLVIGASLAGMPVSTTHVSCGALFGIGTVNRRAHWRMIGQILAAWPTTLPAGVILAATSYAILGWVG